MAERTLELTNVIRLEGGDLAQTRIDPPTPWALIALGGILLVGVAWWAGAGD